MSGNSEILGHHDCDHRTSGVCSTGPVSLHQWWHNLSFNAEMLWCFELLPDFGGRMKVQVNHFSALKYSKPSEAEPWDRNTTIQHFSISQLFFLHMWHFMKVFMKQSLLVSLLRFLSFCNAVCQETNRKITTGCHHVCSCLRVFATGRQQPKWHYSNKVNLHTEKCEEWKLKYLNDNFLFILLLYTVAFNALFWWCCC